LEWEALRAGKVTASEFNNIVTPLFTARDGKMVETYLSQKVAEYWQGGPLPSFSSFAMDQGSLLENADAVPWFELERNCSVQRVGFISHDTLPIGCSPDGIIDGNTGLEVKCPMAPNHVKWLLAGKVPDDYIAQIHFSLYVTVFESWMFLAYRRNFPNLIVEVRRDEEIQEKIHTALVAFLLKFGDAKEKMVKINGGRPPRHSLKPAPACPADTLLKSMAQDAAKPFRVDATEIPT